MRACRQAGGASYGTLGGILGGTPWAARGSVAADHASRRCYSG